MAAQRTVIKGDPLWYKDAVIYELHPRSFCDGNGDGIGDFIGLTSKLDYLVDLGVTALWLLPFYPSPLKDDGYDTADYTDVNPSYGTLADFKEFLNQAHKRGLRVITELVLNHTSDQHEWFKRARRSKPGTPHRNFYVWNSTPDKYRDARIIFKDFEASNWTWDPVAKAYYWHRFYHHQPDLNFENPAVHTALLKIVDFWLAMGVDGLRLDAVPYLYEKEGTTCENLPETHAFLKKVRTHVEKKYTGKMLLAEANQWTEDAVKYFGDGDECHMAFNFPVMPRIFMAVRMEERFPISDILESSVEIPESCQWALFLRNHDELTLEMVTDEERDYMYKHLSPDPRSKINLGIRRRLAPLLDNNRRKIELVNIILFSLPGTPVLYYGDEIGMGDNFYLGDRNGVRTPMQWNRDRNAGFSSANPQQLFLPVIIDPDFHYESVNVENQERNLSSPLHWMRRVIAMRTKYPAFSRGSLTFIPSSNPKVLTFIRRYNDEIVLVAINLSRFSQYTELSLQEYTGYTPHEVFSKNTFAPVTTAPYPLSFGPYVHYWFHLAKKSTATPALTTPQAVTLPMFTITDSIDELFKGTQRMAFERDALLPYLATCRWFSGKGRVVRSMHITDVIPCGKHTTHHFLLTLAVAYTDGTPENYLLPIAYLPASEAVSVIQNHPTAPIARVATVTTPEEGIVCDAVYDPSFRAWLLALLTGKTTSASAHTMVIAETPAATRTLIKALGEPIDSKVGTSQQSNTSIIYNNQLIVKLFRKVDDGINPDGEITQALASSPKLPIAPFAGALTLRTTPRSEGVSIALAQGYIPHESTGWEYVLDNVHKFFERLITRKSDIAVIAHPVRYDLTNPLPTMYPEMHDITGSIFCDMLTVLGKRTGEVHAALASLTSPDFAPEPFTSFYQRSIYQSMETLTRRTFTLLRHNLSTLPSQIKVEAENLAAQEHLITARLKNVLTGRIDAKKMRIHGDYHLGQVLFTGKDFVITDFEGEPSRSLGERRLKRSPLRDVAGMVRSLHYAVSSGLFAHPLIQAERSLDIAGWVQAWHYYTSSVFMQSYISAISSHSLLPANPATLLTLFDAFLLEKAVYELNYELNNRPDWLMIAINGIKAIVKTESKH